MGACRAKSIEVPSLLSSFLGCNLSFNLAALHVPACIAKKMHYSSFSLRFWNRDILKSLNNQAPSYLANFLHFYNDPTGSNEDRCQLRSTSDATRLFVPLQAGDNSFHVCGPHLWNRLLVSIKEAQSVSASPAENPPISQVLMSNLGTYCLYVYIFFVFFKGH